MSEDLVLRERQGAVELLTLTRPKALNALKSKLLKNRDSCALFDTQSFAATLERAYRVIWQRRLNNAPAVPITVTETDAYPSDSSD